MTKTKSYLNHMQNLNTGLIVSAIALFALGGLVGYGLGLNSQLEPLVKVQTVIDSNITEQVAGIKVNNNYTNPFDAINVQSVRFPVEQLNGCRNFAECKTVCSEPKNFQTCVAWSHSQ